MHFTLQCSPFCMKLAQRPLAQSASTVHVAPNTAPTPVPVLLVALLLPPLVLLDVVPPVLDVALPPPLPPWPLLPLLLLAPVVSVPLPLPDPPLPVLSLPHPAVMIPIPMMTGIQRIRSSSDVQKGSIVCGSSRATL